MTKAKALTFHPSKRKRKRTHGFLKRKNTGAGKKVVLRRRRRGRKRLAV